IVDFIDSDNYMTSFPWYVEQAAPNTKHWVYGTELPKLVINEFYAEYTDHTPDPGWSLVPKVETLYDLHVWVELLNPLLRDALGSDPENGDARLRTPAGDPIYQLLITRQNTQIRNPENTKGDPDPDPAAPGTPQVFSREGVTAPPAGLNWG